MTIEYKGVVLSFFDHSTIMVKPWANAGYLCYCYDIKHNGFSKKGNIIKVGKDIRSIQSEELVNSLDNVVFISAFPPCTDIAVSGARWFKDKGLKRLSAAIYLFAVTVEVCESFECPYMIENPVSVISTHWRKPDYKFDPCDYGDPYVKKTHLWIGHGFKMPRKKRVYPAQGSKMHKIRNTKNRTEIRSMTPPGFAKAVFEANR